MANLSVPKKVIDEFLSANRSMDNESVPQNIIDEFLSAARSVGRETVPQNIIDECLSAGREGDIEALYRLLESHPRVLDEIGNIPFAETPLHAAASAGHYSFAVEITRLKSSFLRKLNKNGWTPIHLALQEMHKVDLALQEQRKEDPEMLQTAPNLDRALKARLRNVVLRLLKFDNKLGCVHGKNGFTPLHYAAQIGNLDLLIEFLNSCPMSIFELTNFDENTLHIALKYNQLYAYQLLLIWLHQAWHLYGGPELLDLKNVEGKTCFELAKDKDLSQVNKCEIKRMLKRKAFGHRFPAVVRAETRSAMLVVLLLLVTLTFQTMLTPPGGTWQDDYTCPSNNLTCADKPSHRAGTAIMGLGPYLALLVFNSFNCFALFGLFLSLIPRDNYRVDWLVPLSALIVLFEVSVFVTYPGSKETPPKFVYPSLVVFCATVAFYLSRQFSWPPCSVAVKRFRASINH